MPDEIEAKMKVDDLAAVRAHLESIGAKRAGRALEMNVFFDTRDQSLLTNDTGLRIRRK